MRDYAKVSPQFWIGITGKRLRSAGMEAQIVAMYLVTCPHANMLGLYYLPKLYLEHETGLPSEGASKGLARAIEAGFCHYDEVSEMVWVPEMASYQIGEALTPADKRCLGIQKEYDALPENPFLQGFYERYGAAFNMTSGRGKAKPHRRALQAPPKPRTGTRTGTGDEGASAPAPPEGLDATAWEAWTAYRESIRKPIKPASVPAAQRALAKFGDQQWAVVDHSIANGYQGLYAPKGLPKPTAPGEIKWQ